uniref:Uncharacterized protein n=1 Tax=Oryza nivara TaxID=4536 RepID=A0A0E0I710_ORYNI
MACAGAKQEWGLTSAVVTSSLSAECFSLLSVSPLLWPDPILVVGNSSILVVGNSRGRAEAPACCRSLWRIDGVSRVAKGPSLPLVTVKE